MITFVSISGDVFIFLHMDIAEIGKKICNYVDRNIMPEDDLEKFITEAYYNCEPSAYLQLCCALSK
jgi:hypothetical protein